MRLRRRSLFSILLVATVAACARPAPRLSSPVQDSLPERQRWNQEARGILSDALETLRTFEIYAAFRVGMADQAQLAWDPPTNAEWNEVTHVSRGLHGRAEQLFLQVSTSQVDPTFWRERRDLAEATNGFLELG